MCIMQGETHMTLHDTSCIGKHAAELKRVAFLASHVGSLLKGVPMLAISLPTEICWSCSACTALHSQMHTCILVRTACRGCSRKKAAKQQQHFSCLPQRVA